MSEPAVSTRFITQFLVEHPVAVGYHLAEGAAGPPTKPAYNNHCTICQDPDQTTGTGIPTIILHCGHRYHHACIEEWYSRCPAGHICPTCREPFRPSQQSGNSADDALTGKPLDAEGAVVDEDGTRRWRNMRDELHRDGDRPAVVYANGDQLWYQDGRWHRAGDQPAVIGANGDQYWHRDGELHRDGDQPAAVYANGDQYWWRNGRRHRDGDLPAATQANGDQNWWQNGALHRDGDQPAIIRANGDRYWYQNGVRHRDGNQPAFVGANGDQEWWQNGALHRDGDQPAAIKANGDQYWYRNGKRHRDGDQPAAIKANGNREWWRNGECHRATAVFYASSGGR